MRLLNFSTCGELALEEFAEDNIPPYAILSHTWGSDSDEITLNNHGNGFDKTKHGYTKIQFCGNQARKDRLHYFWVDTCCINRANHTELSEAITSMFRWYRDAEKCYVYLSDVSTQKRDNNGQTGEAWESAFRNSRWFTRGWTLQELLAPESVEFFSREGEWLGSKVTLEQQIHEVTDIPITALRGMPLPTFSVDERFRWAEKRETKKKEDRAYCLLGLFNVYTFLNYGEGENAFIRLREEIDKSSERTRPHHGKYDEVTEKSLSDLQATDPGLDMKRIENSKDPLIKDCYEWVFKDPILHEWQDSDTSPLLWIRGNPGTGKTMLMIAMVRELSAKIPKRPSATTFFFCQSTDPRLNNAPSILRGLIWKLATDHTHLARSFHEHHERNKHMLHGTNGIYALFSTLSAMLEECHRTFLFIDALDECNSGPERDTLIKLITDHAKFSSNTKWLLSSRNNSDIEQLLEQGSRTLSLELNELRISQAVGAFIQHKISELAKAKKYNPDLKEQVKKELITKADSTFLWVALACKSLLKVTRRKTLSTLRNMPPGLKDLYARMMEQVLNGENEEEKEFCLQILRTVSLAFRPLSTAELIIITGLPTELLEDDSLSELIELCGSFIIIRNSALYFVHQSAKEYLNSDAAEKVFPAGLQKERGLIVSRSLDIMSKSLGRDICSLSHPGSPASTAILSPRLEGIRYSCCFWVDHLIKYLDNDVDDIHFGEYLSNQGQVYRFLSKHLLHWFEALSLIREVDRGIIGLYSLERMIRKLPSEISLSHGNFVHDAIRVLRQFRPAVEEAPLQVYCSTLIFSPFKSIVRQNFKQDTPNWVSIPKNIQQDWSPCLQTLEGHTATIISVVYAPHDQQLASGSVDGTVRLWDVATGGCQHTLKGHTDWVNSVVYSPDGRQLASGSGDATVRLWDAATGACQHILKRHKALVKSLVYSPDGWQLASGSRDSTVRLWDAATGACQYTLKGHTDWVNSAVYSPDGRQLASGSSDGTVRLWDAATGVCQRTLKGHTDWVNSAVYSPDGRQLASGCSDGTVRLWDAATGACQHTLKGHTDLFNSAVYSPDGRQLASGSGDATVRLWDAATGVCQHTLKGHKALVKSLVYSPDGRQLASGSGDGTVRLWDAATGVCQHTLEGHTNWVNSAVYSPDGRQLASGSSDGTVRLWDAATGVCQHTLEGHMGSVASSLDRWILAKKLRALIGKPTLQVDHSSRGVGYGIENEKKWITWNGTNVLWLPPEYRPVISAVKESCVAIACGSGLVYLLNFGTNTLSS